MQGIRNRLDSSIYFTRRQTQPHYNTTQSDNKSRKSTVNKVLGVIALGAAAASIFYGVKNVKLQRSLSQSVLNAQKGTNVAPASNKTEIEKLKNTISQLQKQIDAGNGEQEKLKQTIAQLHEIINNFEKTDFTDPHQIQLALTKAQDALGEVPKIEKIEVEAPKLEPKELNVITFDTNAPVIPQKAIDHLTEVAQGLKPGESKKIFFKKPANTFQAYKRQNGKFVPDDIRVVFDKKNRVFVEEGTGKKYTGKLKVTYSPTDATKTPQVTDLMCNKGRISESRYKDTNNVIISKYYDQDGDRNLTRIYTNNYDEIKYIISQKKGENNLLSMGNIDMDTMTETYKFNPLNNVDYEIYKLDGANGKKPYGTVTKGGKGSSKNVFENVGFNYRKGDKIFRWRIREIDTKACNPEATKDLKSSKQGKFKEFISKAASITFNL